MMNNSIEIFARFHVLLVHLPVGFVFLLAGLELLSLMRGGEPAKTCGGAILALTIPASLLVAASGWLLAGHGGYDADVLFWHRWSGAAVAVAVPLVLLFRLRKWTGLYRAGLVLLVGLVVLAGHWGGTLTHGAGYLTGKAVPAPAVASRVEQPAAQSVFCTQVQPILTRYCVSCHGPNKSRGRLRLDSFDAMMSGGKAGPGIEPGASAQSRVLKLMLLPADSEDHMPPAGRDQPSETEIARIRDWIDSGAAR